MADWNLSARDYQTLFDEWVKKYSIFEYYRISAGNKEAVSSRGENLVWTVNGTSEDDVITNGIHEFTDGRESGWYVGQIRWQAEVGSIFINESADLPCATCNSKHEERGNGNPDCECEGEGFKTHRFEGEFIDYSMAHRDAEMEDEDISEEELGDRKPSAKYRSTISIKTAYSIKDPKSISYLSAQFPSILKELYITNFFCQLGVGGKQEEVIVTDLHIAFLPEKKSGWGAGEFNIINVSDISSITVGSEIHIEYRGLTSQSDAYWTLTFNLNNYTQFTRWLFLGKDEKEINKNKAAYGEVLDTLGLYFELLEGDSFESTGGYQTSFGVGFWN